MRRVIEDYPRIETQGLGDREAANLVTRHAHDLGTAMLGQSELLQRSVNEMTLCSASCFTSVAILKDVTRREERIVHWHSRYVREPRKAATARENIAEPFNGAGISPEKTGEALQERRLPCAFTADDPDYVTARHIEIDTVESKRSSAAPGKAAGK